MSSGCNSQRWTSNTEGIQGHCVMLCLFFILFTLISQFYHFDFRVEEIYTRGHLAQGYANLKHGIKRNVQVLSMAP